MTITKLAEDLRGGDVFEHEGIEYVHIAGSYDSRTVTVCVVAIERKAYDANDFSQTVFCRIYHKNKMQVTKHYERRHIKLLDIEPQL